MTQDPADPRPPRSNLQTFGAVLAFAVLAVVAVSVAVLYGMTGLPGKESAGAGAKACPLATAAAAQLAPLAHGEVAGFSVAKTPKPAVDITFEGPDGQKRRLADFRGRVILLNLWATWCVPCREEMPALDRLQEKAGGKDFEVVALNIDTARLERRQQFLRDIGVKSLSFYADSTADVFQVLKRSGKVVGLPTSILIDADGCELGILAGAAAWDSPDALRLVAAARKAAS
ncbi:MAG: tlpA [Hyphomicrobiales bacterium]|nr:tlpA [Hyphomicrobiales bacterium]